MELAMIADIAEVMPEAFDALDMTPGAGACYQRLRQRQADGRWSVRYLRATENGCLKAAVPVYACRGKTWPHPAYDAGTWQLPEDAREAAAPGRCLLVGGCSDARSSLHIESVKGEMYELRRLIAEIARFAAGQNRCLVFPYMCAESRTALTEVTEDRIAWALLRTEARLRGVSDADWESSLGSRVRGVLRRDRRLIAAARLDMAVHPWPVIEDEACKLIADHNVRKGEPDHPEFARLRYTEWQQCAGVELIVFRTASADVTGVLTALIWNDELELCEIGLTGCEGPRRLAAYLNLIFHMPAEFACSRGLRDIRAGFAAETAKRARGATFDGLYGGVLDGAHTRRLAGDRS